MIARKDVNSKMFRTNDIGAEHSLPALQGMEAMHVIIMERLSSIKLLVRRQPKVKIFLML